MKIWIVGVRGLLGSALLRHAPISVGSTREDADICNFASLEAFVKKHLGITHILNCSAFSLVDLAEEKKDEAYQVNGIGPENLGKIAKRIGAKIIHISTDYVFPGNIQRPLHEDDLVGPVNYYGKTKREGEMRLLTVCPSACIIRTAALFGKGGKNFVAKLFDLFREKEEIFLSDDQINSPTCVDALSRVILQMLEQEGIYHFSNQGTSTKYSFGSEIFAFAKERGLKIKTKRIIPVPSSTFKACCPRPLYSALDSSKIAKVLALRIAPWEEALQTFLEGFL